MTKALVLDDRSVAYREDPLAPESSRNEERARHHIRCLKKLGYNTFVLSRAPYSQNNVLYHAYKATPEECCGEANGHSYK